MSTDTLQSKLARIREQLPTGQAERQAAVQRVLNSLCLAEPTFYRMLKTNPSEALKALGIDVPSGREVVVNIPKPEVLSLSIPALHEDANPNLRGRNVETRLPVRTDGAATMYAGSDGATHFDQRVLQLGHRGDDFWTIYVAPPATYSRLDFVCSDGHCTLVSQNVVPLGTNVNGQPLGSKVTFQVHWWFNAYQTATYQFGLWANGWDGDWLDMSGSVDCFSPHPVDVPFGGGINYGASASGDVFMNWDG